MRVRRNIEDTLNLAVDETEDPYGDDIEQHSCVSEKNLIDDYQSVRQNLQDVQEKMKRVIELMLEDFEMAPSVERAEALAKLLEAAGKTSERLLGASKVMADIAKTLKSMQPEDKKDQAIVFKNAFIVGNINDIFKLKKEKEQAQLKPAECELKMLKAPVSKDLHDLIKAENNIKEIMEEKAEILLKDEMKKITDEIESEMAVDGNPDNV